MKTTKNHHFQNILLLSFFILSIVSTSQGSIFKHAKTVDISTFDVIDDDLYAYGNSLIIDGTVTGDVTAFCYRISLNGEISQTASLCCWYLEHNGRIKGSLRAISENINVNGYVSRSAEIFGNKVLFASGSVIEKDVSVYGGTIELNGTIRGNVFCKANKVIISGLVTGNVHLDANTIEIVSPAAITGNLEYVSKTKAEIETANGVSIAGTTTWKLPSDERKTESERSSLTDFLIRVSALFAAFIFGLIIKRVFRPYAEESFNQLHKRFSVTVAAGLLGIGILVMCIIVFVLSVTFMVAGWFIASSDVAPIGSIFLVFSILMVPITSFISVTGGIILYSGKIVVALVLGFFILSKARKDAEPLGNGGLFLGLVVLALLFAIPYAGKIIYWITAVIGSGAILLGIKNCHRPLWNSSGGINNTPAGPIDPQGQA